MALWRPTVRHPKPHKARYGSPVKDHKLTYLQNRPYLPTTQKQNECTFQRFPRNADNGAVASLNSRFISFQAYQCTHGSLVQRYLAYLGLYHLENAMVVTATACCDRCRSPILRLSLVSRPKPTLSRVKDYSSRLKLD
jgi:hypothetical protein